MTLVHESMIAVLNRRFTNCHFNAFAGPGHDKPGSTYIQAAARRAGLTPQYGAIVTPDGKMLTSFGYDHVKVYRALRDVLREHPEFDGYTAEEQAILARARTTPESVAAQTEAAVLLSELLRFDEADALLARAILSTENTTKKATLLYTRGHLARLDPEVDGTVAQKYFDSMPETPANLDVDLLVE